MASLDCRQTPISIPQGFDLSGIPVDKATRLRLIAPKFPPTGPVAALPDGLNLNENTQIELHLSDSRKSASGYRYSLIDSRLTFPAIHNLTGGLPRAELCLYFRNQALNLTSKIVCLCLGLTIGMDNQAPYFTALSASAPMPQRPPLTSLFESDDTFIEYVGADLRGRTLTTPNPSSKCDPVLQKVTYFVCVGQGFIGSQATLARLIGLAGTGLIGPVKQTIKTLPSDLIKYASLVYGIRLGPDSGSGTAGTPTPTSALKCYRIDPSKDIKNGTINLNEPSDGTLADEVVASQISQDAALPAGATSGFQPGDAETYIAITVALILGICLVLYLLNQFYPGGLGQFAGNTGLNTVGTVIAGGAGIAARAIGSGASTVGTAIGTGVRAAGSGIATGAGVAGTAIRSGASAAASGIARGARATSSAIGSGILGASTSIGRMGRGPIPFATSTSGPASGPMSASSAMHSLAASTPGEGGAGASATATSTLPPLSSAGATATSTLAPLSSAGATATSTLAPLSSANTARAIATDVGTLASTATSGISAADSAIARGLDTTGTAVGTAVRTAASGIATGASAAGTTIGTGLRTAGSEIVRGTGAAASAAERGILGLGESFRRPRQGIPFTTSSSSGGGAASSSSSTITAPPEDNSNINPFYQPPPTTPPPTTPPPKTAPSSGEGFSLSRFLGLGGTSVAPPASSASSSAPEGNAYLNPFSPQYQGTAPVGSTGTSSEGASASASSSSALSTSVATAPTLRKPAAPGRVARSVTAAPGGGATAPSGGGFLSYLFGSSQNPPAPQSPSVASSTVPYDERQKQDDRLLLDFVRTLPEESLSSSDKAIAIRELTDKINTSTVVSTNSPVLQTARQLYRTQPVASARAARPINTPFSLDISQIPLVSTPSSSTAPRLEAGASAPAPASTPPQGLVAPGGGGSVTAAPKPAAPGGGSSATAAPKPAAPGGGGIGSWFGSFFGGGGSASTVNPPAESSRIPYDGELRSTDEELLRAIENSYVNPIRSLSVEESREQNEAVLELRERLADKSLRELPNNTPALRKQRNIYQRQSLPSIGSSSAITPQQMTAIQLQSARNKEEGNRFAAEADALARKQARLAESLTSSPKRQLEMMREDVIELEKSKVGKSPKNVGAIDAEINKIKERMKKRLAMAKILAEKQTKTPPPK